MLSFQQIKSIEGAFGADKAGPLIEILESVGERLNVGLRQDLTTKGDLLLLKNELQAEMTELRGEMGQLRTDMAEFKSEIRQELKALELRLTVRMGAMATVIIAVIAALKFFP